MNIHILVDYSYLYYKYKFQLESGKMKRLTQAMEWHGVTLEKDISQIYYSLREIENIRREWEGKGHYVTMSICFDMPSRRKLANTSESNKYKSNRVNKLNTEDFENIQFVQNLLDTAGYNTYRIEGFEADDIVGYLIKTYANEFDYNIIYTPDADLLVNIGNNVGAMRYKSGKGYTAVTDKNFSDYLSIEMKCTIPYNAMTLFKCTVGDKSDCIDGIKGFGPAAFNKLVNHLNDMGIVWSNASGYASTKAILDNLRDYLSENQIEQAYASLELVKADEPTGDEVKHFNAPDKHSTYDKRALAYGPYNMKSLID